MRRNTAEENSEIVVESAAVPLGEAPILGVWIFGMLLILLLATPAALAEPAALALLDDDAPIGVAAGVAAISETPPAQPVPVSMDSLLEISGLSRYRFRTDAQIADELIAAAVDRGTNPELVPLSAFRKRRSDLFRAERPLEIGDQEMLIRLRLRAKARKAMSVEVHF